MMSTFDALPVVLVSALNEDVATEVINELIDNEVTEQYKERHSSDRVWRLVNKYYSADVRLHTLTDNGQMDLEPATVEAHIICLTEDECAGADGGVGCAQRRAGRVGRGAVRVVAARGARGAALRGWAAGARAELAGPGERGADRARAALHAHVWPNLVLRDERAAPLSAARCDSSESSDEEERGGEGEGEGEGEGSDEEQRAVERAEAFVAALGALGGAAEGARAGGAPAALRLRHAEQLVGAFCRALGLDPAAL